jgi:hypothetical protein
MLPEHFEKIHKRECLGLTPEIEKEARSNVEALGPLASCAFAYVPQLLNELDWLRSRLNFYERAVIEMQEPDFD